MIFPEFKDKKFGYVNLNLEAKEWLVGKKFDKENPLTDPDICQHMVEDVHRKLNIDFSYGGWLEERSTLWKGTYLDTGESFVHLGVDINAPHKTKIAASFDAEVVKVDDDYPEEGGWGPRIIVKHATLPIYMIYAHLDRDIMVKVGDMIKKDQVFAAIGKAPFNGNWFPHLHIQTIVKEHFDLIQKNNLWEDLDGYAPSNDIPAHAKNFPDPLQFVKL